MVQRNTVTSTQFLNGMLRLVGDPNSTSDQLMAGIDMLDRMVAADNARIAAMPKQAPITDEERFANLSKRYR